MSFKILVSTVSVFALAACGAPSVSQKVTQAPHISSGLFGMTTPGEVKMTGAGAFKGLDKVTIGSFTVGYATYKTATAKAIKGGTAARNTLLGVNDATMQKITDSAYKSFVSDLKAQGYTVVDRAELMQNADFASTKSYPNPYEDESGGFFGGKSVTKYFAPSSFQGIKIFQGDITGTLGGFATENPIVGAAKYSAATGTRVIHAVYLLDFANNVNKGGVRWSTSVQMAPGMTIVPDASKISVLGDMGGLFSNGNGSITIGQPITSEKDFATANDTTTSLHAGIENAANFIGTLSGVGSSISNDYEFTARPADYQAASLDALAQANNVLVTKMAGLK